MPKIILNGRPIIKEQELSLGELLCEEGFKSGEVAVAVDGEFVPRVHYGEVVLDDTHEVEVVAPMQGG